MPTLPPEFKKHQLLAANPSPFLWLFSLTSPDDGPLLDEEGQLRVIRATANPVAVQYGADPVTGAQLAWYPWDVAFGELPSNSDGTVSAVQLAVGNQGGVMQRILDRNGGLHQHRVRMTLVHADELLNPTAAWEVVLRVRGAQVTWSTVLLELASPNVNEASVPGDLITRSCRWRYRGAECGFLGDPTNALGQCAKHLAACKLRGQWEIDNGLATSLTDADHPLRFGGFPGLPIGAFLT